MNILLVGEFSGFHKALKLGLEELGHNVVLAGSTDGYKNISVDINLWQKSYNKNLFSFIKKQYCIYKKIKHLSNFDIVQFISPLYFNNSIPFFGLIFNKYIYRKLIRNNKKSYLVCCGSDPVFKIIGKNMLSYNVIDAELSIKKSKPYNNKSALKWNLYLAKTVDGVIPTSYSYSLGYEKYKDVINLSQIIPMQIMTSDYTYNDNIPNDKILIFHGVSRAAVKGSDFIIRAMEKIKEKYHDCVEIKIVERLPIDEYIMEIQKTNILIDQCNSYSYGINALIGLSLGKIVLSGAEKVALLAYNVDKSPVINILPDEEYIYRVLEEIILNKNQIQEHGKWSREYVEKYHDSVLIAEKYINFWNNAN